MNAIPIKPEGEYFSRSPISWEPEHPAKNCLERFELSIKEQGQPHAPRGELWQWADHCWTCYMRNSPVSGFEHIHGHFVDADVLREMIYRGEADDLFLGKKFVGKFVAIEDMPKHTKLAGPTSEKTRIG